jgi:Protein of unknown function (DUF4019)
MNVVTRRWGHGETRGCLMRIVRFLHKYLSTSSRPPRVSVSPCPRVFVVPILSVLLVLLTLVAGGCALQAGKGGIPDEVSAVVEAVSEDADQGRYEKIHNEAAEEWRQDATLEKTTAVFSTVRNKLGRVKSRQLHAASEENRSSSTLPAHTFVLTYDTKFEHGDGMETFTLVERNGRWLLARYFVNSTTLQ